MMGLSRDTFYRYKEAVVQGGVEALLDKDRCPPNLKKRGDECTETAVVTCATVYAQVRVSKTLSKQGILC